MLQMFFENQANVLEILYPTDKLHSISKNDSNFK